MATNPSVKPVNRQASTRTQMDVLLGKAEKPLGRLFFVKDGQREFSQFAYSEDWLADAQFFDVSPDLTRQSGYQLRKPPTKNDTCFFLALADTEPDAWGRCLTSTILTARRQLSWPVEAGDDFNPLLA
jgi:serine/threonine-protein kinase HipA